MVQPVYTLKERIKMLIAAVAWKIWLWASDRTEAELMAELYENAVNEYKSEKDGHWYVS
jgi:hypothetical protein